MAKQYFRRVPNFDYVTRSNNIDNISQYTQVKNLFKRGKLRPDIEDNLLFFDKYNIIGDERPDNVAFKFYGDSTLDWVILLSNNILNLQSEWPLAQTEFEEIMLDKYGSYDNLYNGIKTYETKEIRNSLNQIILEKGIGISNTWDTGGGFVRKVSTASDGSTNVTYYYEYYDVGTSLIVEVFQDKLITPITNYEYEERIENNKRSIFVLKPRYLNVVFNDIDEIMTYKKGSEQYVSQTLKRGDNIRLYG
jgi:hypothetical protein